MGITELLGGMMAILQKRCLRMQAECVIGLYCCLNISISNTFGWL